MHAPLLNYLKGGAFVMRWTWIFLVVLLSGFSSTAAAERRVALVIGNSAYQHAPELTNPDNDAGDMTNKLTRLGFEVVIGRDLDLNEMRLSIRDFVGKLEGADVALFFYAGHGVQVSGENYLIPIDAKLTSYNDLDFEALPIEFVLSAMERNASVNLVFLDACRDNPLAETLARSMGTRSAPVGRGLAKLGTSLGSLIAFATQPGNVALDGSGRNSPFTAALLEHLGTPGQSITDDLIAVRRAVLEATDGKQVPWDSSSLTSPVILNPAMQEPGDTGPPAETTLHSTRSVELAYWDSIKDAKSKSYFEKYIMRFPNGLFTDIAKLKIEELDADAQVAKATQPQIPSGILGGEPQTSVQSPDLGSKSMDNPASIQPPKSRSRGKASRIAAADAGPNADPRLVKALHALSGYELTYDFFQGHLYIAVLSHTRWTRGQALAEAAGGHLVTLSSPEENVFVYKLFLEDSRFVRIGEQKEGPWIGLYQPPGSKEPAGGWRWVTGEPFRYKNWTRGQPNNYDPDHDSALFHSYGELEPKDEQRPLRWDDNAGRHGTTGFIVEIEGDPPTVNAGLAAEAQGELARLGCLAGEVDGKWGVISQNALRNYARQLGMQLSSLNPTAEILARLKSTPDLVCREL
jgi:hypothetical protein